MEKLCESEGWRWEGGGGVPTAPVIEPEGGTKRVESNSEHISLKRMKYCHYTHHTHTYTHVWHVVMRQPSALTHFKMVGYLCLYTRYTTLLKVCVIVII